MTKILFSLVIAFFLLGISCKKYEDGPKISFVSDSKRLAQTWALVSDYDVSSGETTSYTIESATQTSSFKEDGTGAATYMVLGMSSYLAFSWEFVDDTQLKMSFNGLAGSSTVTITKLSMKDLWTRDSDGDIQKWSVKE